LIVGGKSGRGYEGENGGCRGDDDENTEIGVRRTRMMLTIYYYYYLLYYYCYYFSYYHSPPRRSPIRRGSSPPYRRGPYRRSRSKSRNHTTFSPLGVRK